MPELCFVSAVTMTAAALVGDQLILEEEYDENYIPSEQGTPASLNSTVDEI